MKTFNDYRDLCFKANRKWWYLPDGKRMDRNKGELIGLIHSEISEALEGERKALMDDKLTNRRSPEVELADAAIRAFDYAGGFNYNLDTARIITLDVMKSPNNVDSKILITNKGDVLSRMHYWLSKLYEYEVLYDAVAKRTRWFSELAFFNPYTPEESLATFISEIVNYSNTFEYDLLGAIDAKMEYNRTRQDHVDEAKALAEGKKW